MFVLLIIDPDGQRLVILFRAADIFKFVSVYRHILSVHRIDHVQFGIIILGKSGDCKGIFLFYGNDRSALLQFPGSLRGAFLSLHQNADIVLRVDHHRGIHGPRKGKRGDGGNRQKHQKDQKKGKGNLLLNILFHGHTSSTITFPTLSI